jgi:hypothetical protein
MTDQVVVDDKVAARRRAAGGVVHVEPWAGWAQWRARPARPARQPAEQPGDTVWCAGLVRAQLVVVGGYQRELHSRVGPSGYRCSMPETVKEHWKDAPTEHVRSRTPLNAAQMALVDRMIDTLRTMPDVTERWVLGLTMLGSSSAAIAKELGRVASLQAARRRERQVRRCRTFALVDDGVPGLRPIGPRMVRLVQMRLLKRLAKAWNDTGCEPCGASLKLWHDWQNRKA